VKIGLAERGVRAVLLDIEGTTTPIVFVHGVLFPYARAHLRHHLAASWDTEETQAAIRSLANEHAADVSAGAGPPALRSGPAGIDRESIAAYAEWLMDRDRKSPGLKLLQGRIWEGGYHAGQLRGEVFADVPPAIRRWRGAGLDVAIYSSGSELAQRGLFASSEYGDLTLLLSGFFDTGMGAKGDAGSYARIAIALRRLAFEVLFVSDVVAELEAARAANLQTALCVRPGNAPQPRAEEFDAIETFDGIEV
jgi:enolase-phosphatase E1